jgi:hypothetical protein
MFYIDDYNSKTITNSPPKREDKIALDKAKKDMDTRQLSIFWYLSGITIANNFTEVKSLLNKYGYKVVNEEDAAVAMSDMLGTAKWAKYVSDFGSIMENTVDERIINQINSEDTGWIEALISAVSSISSSTLNVASSSKELQSIKEKSKTQMISGVTAMLSQNEKTKAVKKTKVETKKNILWIIAVIIVLILISIFIYRRYKADKLQ